MSQQLGQLNASVGVDIKPLETGLNAAKTKLSDFAKGTNSAAFALQNLGRVAQDAPFGFIGIQNNINPLLESFQRLKVETGSTGNALRALGGSLLGAGGLGFAVSAATAILTVFAQQGLGKVKDSTEDAKKETDGYAEAIKKVNEETAQEFSKVSALVDALQREGVTRAQKLSGIKELQQLAPGYFSNLTDEQTLVQNLAKDYKIYADNLYRVRDAKLAEQSVSGFSERLTDISVKLHNINSEFNKEGTFAGQFHAAEIQEILSHSLITYQEINKLVELTGFNEVKIKTLLQQRNSLTQQQTVLLEKVKQATDQIGQAQIFQDTGVTNVTKKIKETKKDVNELKDDLLNLYNLKGAVQAPGAPETKTPLVPLIGQGDSTLKGIETNAKKSATVAAKSFKDIFQSTFEGLFDSIGESIGNALSGKENPFQAFAEFMGGALKGIGQQLVAFGVEAELIKLALKNPFAKANPFLLIAGGIALEAIGTAFQASISGKTTPHAEGGVFTGPTQIGSHLFGEAGPEFLVGQNKLQQLLQETGARSNHVTVDGSISLGYNEIKIALSRADRYRGRNYGPGNG